MRYFIFIVLAFCSPLATCDTLIVRHRAPESTNDLRQNYNIALIRLALEKTRSPNEVIKLEAIPTVSSARARLVLNSNRFQNLILEFSYEDDMKDLGDIDYAVFPIELGALSYRTCFISPRYQQSLNKVKTLTELREKRHATGIERSFTALPPAPILFCSQKQPNTQESIGAGIKTGIC